MVVENAECTKALKTPSKQCTLEDVHNVEDCLQVAILECQCESWGWTLSPVLFNLIPSQSEF